MLTIISSEQMKRLDNKAITEFGIPSRILMENAGKGCADLLFRLFPDYLRQGTVILCGTGNNGGDGYVIARWLSSYGIPVFIIKVGEGKSSPETLANMSLCQKKEKIEFIETTDEDYAEFSETVLSQAGVIIDAIYGIGFKGSLQGEIAELIMDVNLVSAVKVAIDIPSGVNADTGAAELAFHANVTIAIESFKFGHFVGRGKEFSGLVQIVPIGIPEVLWEDETAAVLMTELAASLPIRSKFAHKGDYGRIAVFAGSPGFTGAAFMASIAALKAGAGLVTIFAHPEHLLHYANKPYEVMVKAVPVKSDKKIDLDDLDASLENMDVVLFGPGCGVCDYTHQLLEYFAGHWNKPAVIDADGLNTLAQHPDLLKKLVGKPFVLTPHWGEFCRLAKIDLQALEQDCLSELKRFVETNHLKVLLKSHTSIYYDQKTMYINTSGNDGLATGGSGDILSGLIAGFLAQNLDFGLAAGSAAFYLGRTAEKLAEIQPAFSITPSDILDNIFIYDLEDEQDEN